MLSPSQINKESQDVILAAISSKIPHKENQFELVLSKNDPDFSITGLRVSSVIKTNKLVSMQKSLIYRGLGKITAQSLKEVDQRVSNE